MLSIEMNGIVPLCVAGSVNASLVNSNIYFISLVCLQISFLIVLIIKFLSLIKLESNRIRDTNRDINQNLI